MLPTSLLQLLQKVPTHSSVLQRKTPTGQRVGDRRKVLRMPLAVGEKVVMDLLVASTLTSYSLR